MDFLKSILLYLVFCRNYISVGTTDDTAHVFSDSSWMRYQLRVRNNGKNINTILVENIEFQTDFGINVSSIQCDVVNLVCWTALIRMFRINIYTRHVCAVYSVFPNKATTI